MSRANGAPADPTTGQGVHDREIDAPHGRAGGRRRRPVFQGHQRLVANPFLAIVGLIAWYATIRQFVRMRRLDLFIPALASVVLVYFLFQYHCLDCGKTGRLARWRDHECASVRLRAEAGLPRRLRVMTPTTQTLLWFYLIGVCGIVAFILSR